jgi:G:T-mismatch repair DNA endonuclease (very short patch repair protein)
MSEWDHALNKREPSNTPITYSGYAYWRCVKEDHRWKSKVSFRFNRGWGCPFCASQESITKVYTARAQAGNSFAHLFPELLEELADSNVIDPYTLLPGSHTKLLWRCKEKNHEWLTAPNNRVSGSGCPECWRLSGKSQLEKDVAQAVRDLGYELRINDRKAIHPLELDIYLPSMGVAVEVNGDYWHSDEMLLRNRGMTAQEFHGSKLQACEAAGIRLLFVWEGQWLADRTGVTKALQEALQGKYVESLTQLTLPSSSTLASA